MPYENEHACRLEDPKKFDRFNRVNCEQKHDGKCIDVIYGIKTGKSKIQALRYPKDVWDADDARAHCKDRGGTFEAAKEKEKDSMPPNYEMRHFTVDEIRANDDGPPKISGHAAVFNKPSEVMGFFGQKFIEKIKPGFFKNAIKNSDTRSTFNHNPDILLGRKSAGTLKLREDEKGLFMEVEPPDTQYIKDVVIAPIKRGDVKEQSFGFTVKTEEWEDDKEKGTITRTLIECDQLFDVGPVTFPAYPDTSVAVRSYEQWRDNSRSEPDPTGVIPEGWEDIKSADVDKVEADLHDLDIRLRKIEVSKL